MNELSDIHNSITSRQPNDIVRIILYDDFKLKDNVSKRILIATIQSIKSSNIFYQSLIKLATQKAIPSHQSLFCYISVVLNFI